MQIIIDVKNKNILEKLLWMLGHFSNDGVDIKIDTKSTLKSNKYTDEYVEENWKEIAYTASGNPSQNDDEVLEEEYGKYLYAKHNI